MEEQAVGLRRRAFIYLRVSTSAQAEKENAKEGFSIPAQRDACVRAAERLGAEVIESMSIEARVLVG